MTSKQIKRDKKKLTNFDKLPFLSKKKSITIITLF